MRLVLFYPVLIQIIYNNNNMKKFLWKPQEKVLQLINFQNKIQFISNTIYMYCIYTYVDKLFSLL